MSIKEQLKVIKENFILCGKPKVVNYEIVGWTTSVVRLDLIKTIHVDERYIKNIEEECIFYTYKDEWYICSMNYVLLTQSVNKYLQKISHGSEENDNQSQEQQ